MLCVIFSADICQGGHVSFFLHVVKTPLDIIVSVPLDTIVAPLSLGSLSFLKVLLVKSIEISFPNNFFDFKFKNDFSSL